mmetsp:Transcript_56573/g.101430  ORF Transcript_56573/g.101430 Transcript_56573/m.101430 type:complete len:245 (-) Transcript_56573:196-930(-)
MTEPMYLPKGPGVGGVQDPAFYAPFHRGPASRESAADEARDNAADGSSGWFTPTYSPEVAAAAAAAIEQPVKSVASKKADRAQRDIMDAINAAQSEAANRRRGDVPGTPGQSASRPEISTPQKQKAPRGNQALDSMIRGAQIAARGERRRAAPGEPLMPEDFLGNWVDTSGNSVHIYSVDAYDVRLVATLSRYPRNDVHLNIRQVMPGAWVCGNSALSAEMSSPLQLVWQGADGRISTWTRGRG